MDQYGTGPRVRVRYEDAVALVSVGWTERRTALTGEDWAVLETVFSTLAGDDQLQVAVIRGAGVSPGATAGLGDWVTVGPDEGGEGRERLERVCTAVAELPVPVIAAVEGTATGAGCQLAWACDLQVLTVSARIGRPFPAPGVITSPALVARLVALAGPAAARDLLATGRVLGGPEALALGLASRCVPDGAMAGELGALVAALVAQPPAAVRAAKAAAQVRWQHNDGPAWSSPAGPSAETGSSPAH